MIFTIVGFPDFFFLKLPEQCKNIDIRKCYAQDLRGENVILCGCVALPYHANKQIDNSLNKNKYVNLFFRGLKISCIRNVQNFIGVP